MARETSQTLDRGLTVLEALAGSPTGMTVNQLAAALGVGRTVVYRLVATLEDHRLVRRDRSGRVVLWLGLAAVARGVEPLLRTAAAPALTRLAEECGASASLTVCDGADGVVVAVVDPLGWELPPVLRVGTRQALERTAAGRAILRARDGVPAVVVSAAESTAAAAEVATPVLGVPGLEAGVAVVSLRPLDPSAGPAVVRAASELRSALS
jgi:DNA-binding IclR family transcriptional regulator